MGIFSPRIKVAVIRGGPSGSYEKSLQTGAYVLSLLRDMPEKYEPLDVFISKTGDWHYGGLAQEPREALRHADLVWNALHGTYGEDGQVQHVLEGLGIPFIGPTKFAANLSLNKHLAKELYQRHSLLTPASELITRQNFNDDKLIEIFRTYLHPVIIKPADGSHSFSIKKAYSYQELKDAIEQTLEVAKRVLVEEFIKGEEWSCGVLEGARGEQFYNLVPVRSDGSFRMGGTHREENSRMAEMSKVAHEALGLRHYSSSDFIITPKGKIYILETNALPVLTEDSLMHKALKATGWNPKDFAEHCVKVAMGK
ncbi:ATP-grasp domain-containing protein [Candidatus Parcubacteria bacterium]|nr:ATP-grasp domain-containing protein [Candidatus Parcubacteria bacterium]